MAISKDCSFLPPPRILTHGRFLVLILGLLALTANSMADVTFNGTTFTGEGTYDQAAGTADTPLTANLVVSGSSDSSTITLSGGVYTTGNLTHSKGILNIAEGSVNSCNNFGIQKGGANGTTAYIYGTVNANSLTLNKTGSCTAYLNISGNLTVSGNVIFNGAASGQGILTQTGGTVNFTTSTDQGITIGHYETSANYPARYNLRNGTFNALNATVYVGWNGPGELNISGGEANLKGIQLVGGWNQTDGYAAAAKGTINLTGGKLNIGANGITLKNSRHAINLGDGTIGALASHTWASTLTVTLTSGKTPTFDIDANKTITINSKIAGSGGLKKTGDGTLTLTARNTFSGGTTVSAGKIISKADNAKASAFGTGAILVESGATLEFQVSNQLGYDANAPNDITIKGTLIPSNYTHVKNITLQNGVIESEYGYSSGGSGLDFGTRTATVTSTGNSIIKSRFTINSGAKPTFYVQSGTLTIEGVIKSDGGFTKTGAGTVTLTGTNDYTGATTVSGGTLKLSGNGTLGTSAVTIGKNAALEINYANYEKSVNITSVTMTTDNVFNEGSAFKVPSGAVTFGTTDVALNNLSGGEVENGQITVPSSLTVAGKLTLNNDQLTKFIGSITAPEVEKTGLDTLQLCFDAQNGVDITSMIVSSGRMDLKGYMLGGIEVDKDAVFSPGNSVGDARFGGGYELKEGATLLIEQDETGIDTLTASSFNIDSNSIIDIAADSLQPGAEYPIIVNSSGDFSGDLQNDNYWNGLLTPGSDYYWNLSVRGNTVYASVDANAVPEPSTWALLILGAAGLLYVRKRNK